jgi:hypothetical protein
MLRENKATKVRPVNGRLHSNLINLLTISTNPTRITRAALRFSISHNGR